MFQNAHVLLIDISNNPFVPRSHPNRLAIAIHLTSLRVLFTLLFDHRFQKGFQFNYLFVLLHYDLLVSLSVFCQLFILLLEVARDFLLLKELKLHIADLALILFN